MAQPESPVAAVFQQRLSYSQCWEDWHVLLAALSVGPDDDVLSIASGGDNSFALALAGARSVTAIDLSLPQLAVTELKLAATELPYDAYLGLLGARDCDERWMHFKTVEPQLTPGTRAYWRQHRALLEGGVLRAGRFERYLEAFRTRILPLVHRRRVIDRFSDVDNLEAQRDFYARHWDTVRWRWLFRVFFSRAVMSRTGRTAAHFAHVKGRVSSEFLARTRNGLTRIPIADNPYAQWALHGRFTQLAVAPLYLTPDGHRRLRTVRPRIRLLLEPLEAHLSSVAAQSYSAFNYSNVFEYVSDSQHEALLRLTLHAARRGARIAYWNLLVPRHRPDSMAAQLRRGEADALKWLSQDRAIVYGGFNLETVV